MDNISENESAHYFLRETAIAAWKKNDMAIQDKMFVCIAKFHKENWFRRVIYTGGTVAEWHLTELAGNAFLLAWEKFNTDGKSGKLVIHREVYVNLLYKIFKNTFLKLLAQQRKMMMAEDAYAMNKSSENEMGSSEKDEDDLYNRTQKVLSTINPNCAELMQWRYKEKLSFDEIAHRKGIKPESCKQNLWRCKELFLEKFGNSKK